MLRFNKLRLVGFKSFVDSTELQVEPGLTGVVGPNGCGKSNLVEALRWVMGETSAKQMRGSEMDDVIFGGTASRPSRNVAEVLLSLNNEARTAPAQFNDFDELEVSRRIERAGGSTYRVNGREVRARDVQLLFADSATGARSTALVSQGRVGAIIAAKPQQRRALLEEAAGITGLHSRRHEAELRLRAAETNLERLEDIMATLEAQLGGLRKQSRQATRYRNLSGHIRRAEATQLLLRWIALEVALEAHRAALREAEGRVAAAAMAAGRASTVQAEVAEALPPLRRQEAEAAAALHRLNVALDSLEKEAERVAASIEEGRRRLAQADADMIRERALAAEAEAATERLAAERGTLEAAMAGEAAAETAVRGDLESTSADLAGRESALQALIESVASQEAEGAAATRRRDELGHRLERLSRRIQEAEAQQASAKVEAMDPSALKAATVAFETARDALEASRKDVEAAEAARAATGPLQDEAIAAKQAADADLTGLVAEEKALADLLEVDGTDLWPPLVDAVTVDAGWERALAAAFGDDLSVPANEAAPVHWRTLPPLSDPPSLPEGAAPLSARVKAPPALARRLSQIGVVADAAQGRGLRGDLKPGQRLVSRDGGLWRWDGYSAAPDASTGAAARLEQRNRLRDVRRTIESARNAATTAAGGLEAARARVAEAITAERAARDRARQAQEQASRTMEALSALKERAARHDARLIALQQTLADLARERQEAEAAIEEATAALDDLADPAAARRDLDDQRMAVTDRRDRRAACQQKLDTLLREAAARRQRVERIVEESAGWFSRRAGAAARLAELESRRAEVDGQLTDLSRRPADIDDTRRRLMSELESGEAKRRTAADRLADAEARLAEATTAQRAAEADVAATRENRVRAEAAVAQEEQARRALAERVTERLDCAPLQLRDVAELPADKPLPDLATVDTRLERLIRERDTMGPVNLRAEQEAAELTEQLEVLETERQDLVEAIAKLRRGISVLNREGRERLLASFHEVDRHFRDLFERLFGGGRAHLQLTESDDPLEAGLEIMASPPGKRLQVLSLLSGGEQALTALALLFAAFLTNPAPICVLDEVDAPLDDANVDRFCSLVEEIAHSLRTRFMIITHHRMTMARMDRLFGVTMAERGVSQLVSVDLVEAEALRATA